MQDRSAPALRAEFWNLANTCPDAYVDRATAGAAMYKSISFMEKLAAAGTGPAYVSQGKGSQALYRVRDVVAHLEKTGRVVTSTAQVAAAGAA